MKRTISLAVMSLALGSPGVIAQGERFGPADPVVKDEKQLDPRRPIEAELQASVPDGFTAAAVGDLIISRPLSQLAPQMPAFAAVIEILRGTSVAFGNLETTIFDPQTFAGSPYSWDGDWTNASVPAVAGDLRNMGFDIVGRANNHSQDWGVEGMRETAKWLDHAGIAHAGAGESHRMARAPAYFESPLGRIGLVSIASTFRPTSESLPPAATAPGRPGLSALRVRETVAAPKPAVEALARAQCALYGRHCDGAPKEGSLFGTSYRQADRLSREHVMDPGDLAEIYAAVRAAQLNADFVIVAIHAHECSLGCDGDNAPRGAADFLKELARGAIDSGADLFVTTGNHNLGPMEIYDSPARGKRPIFYGLGNFFWSDVQELLPADLFAGNRELIGKTWQHPQRATEYDLTASLNAGYFANAFTFQSVIAEVRYARGELSEVVLHPVELGYGDRLTTSGIPRLVTDPAAAREITGQIVQQTAQFGLPDLGLRHDGARAVITVGR
jgi:poly-gamma-glutamate capsule biosynthesis protein CapA/YwtB (metallophosphatase superfamily)